VKATRDIFLSGNKRRYKTVTLPTSGVECRIQSMTEHERSEFEAANFDKDGNRINGRIKSAKGRLICLCLVDDDGKPLLLPGDEQSIMEMDSADTTALWDECWNHIGYAKPVAVEDQAKN
jgi:hypothetical protein